MDSDTFYILLTLVALAMINYELWRHRYELPKGSVMKRGEVNGKPN